MTVELSGDDILRDGAKVGHVEYVKSWRRWKWSIADAVGDEDTRQQAQDAARIFLASREAGRKR